LTMSVLLAVSLGSSSGCARRELVLLKDSDLVYSGKAGVQPTTPAFDWVLMSQNLYRETTD